MATSKSEEATNARVVTKDVALSVCRAAMTQMMEQVCGVQEYQLKIPDGHTADDVAAAVGGSVVTFGVAKAGQRVVIVRIAVGMLTSSFAAQQLPQALYQIEHVASTAAPNIAKVTAPILKQAPKFDFVPVAQAIKSTAPIVGDSVLVKALSKAGAEFNVFASIMETFQNLRADLSGETDEVARKLSIAACCDAVTLAFKDVWKKAPKVFHEESYRTQTGVKRFYGRKPVRV